MGGDVGPADGWCDGVWEGARLVAAVGAMDERLRIPICSPYEGVGMAETDETDETDGRDAPRGRRFEAEGGSEGGVAPERFAEAETAAANSSDGHPAEHPTEHPALARLAAPPAARAGKAPRLARAEAPAAPPNRALAQITEFFDSGPAWLPKKASRRG